jgi:hypothetical protein
MSSVIQTEARIEVVGRPPYLKAEGALSKPALSEVEWAPLGRVF